MTSPTIIDIPHTLGREEAKRRMVARVGKLASHIPGGAATVTHYWPSANRMALTVTAMGMEVPCTVDAEDDRLRVTVCLSGMLSLMAAPIASMIKSHGERLMVEDRSAALSKDEEV